MWLLILIVLVVECRGDDTVGEITLVKNLLQEIFRRYKSDMDSLQSLVELSTTSLHSWRNDVSGRLDDLEIILGSFNKKEGEGNLSIPGKETITGLRATVDNLVELTRSTTARSCNQLRRMGVRTSGEYYIDPDGTGVNSAPVKVYCDMKTGSTRVDHNLQEQEIGACRERGCFVRAVDYKIAMKQIASLTVLSTHCEQYIRYDCHNAPLNFNNESNGWWMDRNDMTHFYWSGDSTIEDNEGFKGTCYCHLQKTCISKEHRCNCDAGESIWSFDDGQLTDKSQLPVTKLNFGNFYKENQMAKFYLGPLVCSGARQLPLEMDSCESLWLAGVSNPGYQIVKQKNDTFPKIVYCDMKKLPGSAGFQRTYGSPGNLRDFVAFDAYISQDITDSYRYIGFTDTVLNIGGGLNVKDGIFEAPVTGTYMFSAHALPLRNRPFNVQLQLNNRPIGSFSNNKSGLSMAGQSIIIEVAEGDQIRLFNSGGEVAGEIINSDIYFHFVGVLLNSYNRN